MEVGCASVRKQSDRYNCYYSCEDEELNPKRYSTYVKLYGDWIVFADSENTNVTIETAKCFCA